MIVHVGNERTCARVLHALEACGEDGRMQGFLRLDGSLTSCVTADVAGWVARAVVALLFDHGVRADQITRTMLLRYDKQGEVSVAEKEA